MCFGGVLDDGVVFPGVVGLPGKRMDIGSGKDAQGLNGAQQSLLDQLQGWVFCEMGAAWEEGLDN